MSATLAAGALAGALGSSVVRRLSSSSGNLLGGTTTTTSSDSTSNTKNVGILGIEIYTPSTYVLQSELEEHTGVASGKYTIGLGQHELAVISGDAEDINSLALTVVHSLLEKYGLDPTTEIGRVEVGTETLVDKSKSTKTVLMDLFPGNTDIEGATIVNACYGGTAALLNACNWVESDSWDGRLAIVVAADIAAYARGPARPTCGAGAVAILIGRDAPLVLGERATHCAHVWDFFKPDPSVEYPTVDGALSQVCYYQALQDVYMRLADKVERTTSKPFTAETPDYFCFHAPYNKLVQKSYGRLYFMDAKRSSSSSTSSATTPSDEEEKKQDAGSSSAENMTNNNPLQTFLDKPMEETYADKSLEKVLKGLSSASFKKRLYDANYASQKVGNTYTASVFFGLASLIDRVGSKGELKQGKSICVFSYGSGALATMYRLQIREPSQSRFTIPKMVDALKLMERLEQRERIRPEELDYALDTRARMHHSSRAPYSPVYPTVGRMFPGTYYLTAIDAKWRRHYSRVPLDATIEKDGSLLAPPLVLRQMKQDAISTPVTGKLRAMSEENPTGVVTRIACVITGTAAGLPGSEKVFDSKNLDRLIEGKQCIGPISGTDKMALLDKNVVQVKKNKDGTIEKVAVDTEDQVIKLAAQIGSVDLTASYGVPPGLAETMDVAAQVAVAAGMEALKNAGLVRGKSPKPEEWKIAEKYRDTTGVLYCSSFPAMDAAVGEVMRFLQSKTVGAADSMRLISALRSRMLRASPERELSDDDEAAFARLLARAHEIRDIEPSSPVAVPYIFDRKFLFRVLVLGNAQLAQLAGARGPNTQTNAACAGTTQAIAMAQDMLISGRAERVVVVAGDNASGSTLLPWLGSGFRALGAASTANEVENAACPFDKRRNGMLLGAGAIGMVIETEESCNARKATTTDGTFEVKARLLATQYSNSAFHGAALDRNHIGSELTRFLNDVELIHGISKAEIASHGVYLSHETSTHATSASSCAGNEIAALRMAFGDNLLSKMRLLNTKGFTGHPMGVSFEDVTAVEILLQQKVPPLPNHKEKDDYLGDLNISTTGGPYACRYALRFAAGFGSQVAFALYATAQYE